MSGSRKNTPPPPPQPTPQTQTPPPTSKVNPLQDALARQPSWLRSELEALRKHEAKVLGALKDEKQAYLFYSDPAALLKKIGIPVSSQLRARLQTDTSFAELAKKRCFTLPNGQNITPRVRVRFTREEG
jgi:hypothetical protein